MEMTPEQLKLVGSIEFFDEKPFLACADQLVGSDNPMLALELLKCLPAYYRDNTPKDILTARKDILAKVATPAFYAKSDFDAKLDPERALASIDGLLRGHLIQEDIKKYNAEGITPHIVDMGPGEYWIPIALKQKGYQFTYQGIGLCKDAERKAREYLASNYWELENQPHTIYLACEIIEHLHYENEIFIEFMRHCPNAEIIHVSTPKYTYDGRAERINWRKYGDLGHLRTYTPKEFVDTITTMFMDYDFGLYDNYIMHLKGVRKNGLSKG